jgi:tRNA(Ile)-lysidine synthase
MLSLLEQSLLDVWPKSSWSTTRILVAVSGGADSVALLRALQTLTDNPKLLHVAHFNHQWRGLESDTDEQFVSELCSNLSLPLVSMRADMFDVNSIQQTEQAARTARYLFLTRTAYTLGARYVVTAHTASDRIETMLHNLFRGTGLNGVTTPTRFRTLDQDLVLARPLLRCTRSQIINYLSELGQDYRHDSSNLDTAFKRNFIRQKVLPLIESEYGRQFDERLYDFTEIAEEAAQALRFYAESWLEVHVSRESADTELALPMVAFRKTPWPVVQMALESCWKERHWPLQGMSRFHWLQIRALALVDEPSKIWRSKLNLPGNLRLSAKAGWIRIERDHP